MPGGGEAGDGGEAGELADRDGDVGATEEAEELLHVDRPAVGGGKAVGADRHRLEVEGRVVGEEGEGEAVVVVGVHVEDQGHFAARRCHCKWDLQEIASHGSSKPDARPSCWGREGEGERREAAADEGADEERPDHAAAGGLEPGELHMCVCVVGASAMYSVGRITANATMQPCVVPSFVHSLVIEKKIRPMAQL